MTHIGWTLCGGYILGCLFGALAQRTSYCMAGGLREWWRDGQYRRVGALLVAIAFALLGTQLLSVWGVVDLQASRYMESHFSWLLIPSGGFLFGYGMIRARGCGARALVLLGGGNLRSLVVVFGLGLSAAATLTGVLAPLRVRLTEWTLIQWPASISSLPALLSTNSIFIQLLPALCVSVVLFTFAWFRLALRKHPAGVAGSACIGLLVPAGWWVTGVLGADDFDPVRLESLSFIAPVSDTLQYIIWSTGMRVNFGVLLMLGVLSGAWLTALVSRTFEWQGFSSVQDLRRLIFGSVCMGIGGVMAVGCSVGQGLTGISTLSFTSLLALAGILTGARVAVARLGADEI